MVKQNDVYTSGRGQYGGHVSGGGDEGLMESIEISLIYELIIVAENALVKTENMFTRGKGGNREHVSVGGDHENLMRF